MESTACHPPTPRARQLLCACFVALAFAAHTPAQTAVAPITAAARIRTALDYDDFNTATRLLNEELNRAPGDEQLLSLKAEVTARRGQLAVAVQQVKTLVNRNPSNLDLRLRLAQYTSWQGRLVSASAGYAAIANAAPDNAAARVGLGNTAYWLGQWREAQTAFAAALALGENAEARLGWLRVIAASGHPSDAAREALAFDKATGRREAEVGLFLAELYAAVNADDQVQAYAARRTPDGDLLRRQNAFRAQRLLARGAKAEATQLARQWAGEHPNDYLSLVDAGDVCTAAGLLNDARPYYQRAATITPERPEALLGLARLATRGGRLAEGLQAYEELANANPESIEAWLGVARTAQLRGDKNRAWAALDQAFRVAPRSALVYDEMCRLAFETNHRERMQTAAHGFLLDQPFDTRGEIWLQRWNSTHGAPADVARLNALLDPLAPENTRLATELIRGQTKESPQQVMARVPPAGGGVQLAAQETLENQAKIAQRENIRAGVSTGYEYSYVHDSTSAKAKLPDWHEAYVAAFWGQPKLLTYSLDTRRYERFGELAWQVNPGVAWEFTDGWVWRVESGFAAQGDIIPRWRTGMGLDWYQPQFTASLDLAYLNFADANVWLLTPGLAWNWSDQWSTSVKVYVARNQLRGKRTDYTATAAFGVGWQFTPLSSVGAIYSVGGENAAEPLKGLIGEGLFQSVALNYKWGITEHWALEPVYRFESHPNFDTHAAGINLHWRY